MADQKEVMASINRVEGVTYSTLTPNVKGFESAKEAQASEVAVFAAASESFSQKNINCSIEESIGRFVGVMEQALDANIPVRGYVSCVLGCPYEGHIQPQAVARVAERLVEIGCHEISLGDTIGVGTVEGTRSMLKEVMKVVDTDKLAVHFHDTYGQALPNILAALEVCSMCVLLLSYFLFFCLSRKVFE